MGKGLGSLRLSEQGRSVPLSRLTDRGQPFLIRFQLSPSSSAIARGKRNMAVGSDWLHTERLQADADASAVMPNTYWKTVGARVKFP